MISIQASRNKSNKRQNIFAVVIGTNPVFVPFVAEAQIHFAQQMSHNY